MTAPVEVLTKANCLTRNVSPTGQKYKIDIIQGTTLYEITLDGGVGGRLPLELAGIYTSGSRAQTVLTQFLLKFWAKSDAKVKKVA